MRNLLRIFFVLSGFFVYNSVYAAGGKLLAKVVEETLETAAKKSGRVLTPALRVDSERILKTSFEQYGDEILPLVKSGGLEVLEQGAKHGDEFWKSCRRCPRAARVLALHPDELLPLVRRIGPEVLELEARSPGMARRIVREFGDDSLKVLMNAPEKDLTRLTGYAAKADSPETRKMLLDYYGKSANPGTFLDSLSWKTIMATGLSASLVIAAWKVSDGTREALVTVAEKKPELVMEWLSPIKYFLFGVGALVLCVIGITLVRFCPWLRFKKTKKTPSR